MWRAILAYTLKVQGHRLHGDTSSGTSRGVLRKMVFVIALASLLPQVSCSQILSQIEARRLNSEVKQLKEQAQYPEALKKAWQALEFAEKALGSDHPDTATSVSNLGFLYREMGQYELALSHYQRALRIREVTLGPEHHDTATSVHNLGFLYKELGQSDQALDNYRRALKILANSDPMHPDTATSFNTVGVLYHDMGQYEQALSHYQQALRIREVVLDQEHPDTATSHNNLGSLYNAMGQYELALSHYRRALTVWERKLGPEHPDTAATLNNLGSLYNATGHHDKALSHYQRAFAIAMQHPNPVDRAIYGENLCAFHRARAEVASAIFYCKLAVNESQQLRQGAWGLNPELQRALAGKVEPLYQILAKLLIREGRVTEAEQVLGMLKEYEFFEYVRRSESRDVRSSRADFTDKEKGLADSLEMSARELSRIYEERQRLSQLTLPTAEQKHQLARLEEQKRVENERLVKLFDDIKQQLTQQNRSKQDQLLQELVESKGGTEGTLKTLKQLSQKEPILIYFLPEDKTTLFLIHTREGLRQIQDGLGEAALNEKIVQLRQAIQGKEEYRKLADELYQALIIPIEPYLKEESHLMLYLTDALRYLPFAALYDSRSKQHLVQKHSLSVYTHVGRDKLDRLPEQHWSAVGLGTSHKTPHYPALPWVTTELKRIVREAKEPKYSGVIPGKRYLDNDFSHQVLMHLLSPESALPVMHVATHFTLAPGNDSNSALVLGNGDTLKLSEISANAQLSGYDLITLSACETALGAAGKSSIRNIAAGAEVEGLGALLQRQGAKAVLATLWKVEDSSTASLMEQFYKARGEERKTTKSQALRQAQLALLMGNIKSEGKHDLRHPYYWASFILMGNWL